MEEFSVSRETISNPNLSGNRIIESGGKCNENYKIYSE